MLAWFTVSLRSATEEHHRYGSDHDLQVLQKPLPLQVLEVVAHLGPHVIDAAVVAVVDLRPSRYAGLRTVTQRIMRDVAAELKHDRRTLGSRPNDVHVATHHVPQLRYLVQPRAAQEAADRRDTGVILRCPDSPCTFCIDNHRAKLVDREDATAEVGVPPLRRAPVGIGGILYIPARRVRAIAVRSTLAA